MCTKRFIFVGVQVYFAFSKLTGFFAFTKLTGFLASTLIFIWCEWHWTLYYSYIIHLVKTTSINGFRSHALMTLLSRTQMPFIPLVSDLCRELPLTAWDVIKISRYLYQLKSWFVGLMYTLYLFEECTPKCIDNAPG